MTEAEAAATAFAARASKVLLLRLPFGRPRLRDVEGAVSGTLTSSLFPSGTLLPLEAEPLGDDMVRLGSKREGSSLEEKWGMPRAVSMLGI
jgi:hypothetical protein